MIGSGKVRVRAPMWGRPAMREIERCGRTARTARDDFRERGRPDVASRAPGWGVRGSEAG
ncbi:hypothetical protein GCM10027271_15820 [Saccharopolyspora gloriosae]